MNARQSHEHQSESKGELEAPIEPRDQVEENKQ